MSVLHFLPLSTLTLPTGGVVLSDMLAEHKGTNMKRVATNNRNSFYQFSYESDNEEDLRVRTGPVAP